MITSFSRLSIAFVAFVALAPVVSAGGVRIVTDAGDRNYSDIQSAVDAALEGDALLVAEGAYEPFTVDGKSLSIFAVPGSHVTVRSVTIQNLDPGQVVVLSGFEAAPERALLLYDNQGFVRLQDCSFGVAYSNNPFICPAQDGDPGVVVSHCARVAFLGCSMIGGPGDDDPALDEDDLCFPGDGGAGLEVASSSVALYECTITGGGGGSNSYYAGGRGGVGLLVQDSEVFASGGFIHGGDAAITLYPPYLPAPGGDGVSLSEGSEFRGLDCDLAPGGGTGGQAVSGSGLHVPLKGSARAAGAVTVASSDRPLSVAYTGEPGDTVWFPRSIRTDHQLLPAANGVWLTQFPPSGIGSPAGVVPQGEEQLDLEVSLLDPPHGAAHTTVVLQGVVYTRLRQLLVPGGSSSQVRDRYLSSARHVLALDPLGGPDCNGNGVSDYLDVALGTSSDSNHDVVPDECSPPVLHVDVNSAPGGDGSAAAPFQSIAEAVVVAVDGSTVLVADGIYTGPDNREIDPGPRELKFRSDNGPTGCIIDLQGSRRAFMLDQADGSLGSLIEGFTIRNGGSAFSAYAIGIDQPNVTVSSCVLEYCADDAVNLGSLAHDAVIDGCRMEFCGVGIRADVDSLTVRDSVLLQNHEGLNLRGTGVLVVNCLVAGSEGRGIRLFPGSATSLSNRFVNLTVVGNQDYGLLMANIGGTVGTVLSNCVFWDNQGAGGAQIRLSSIHSPTTIEYCDVQGGLAAVDLNNTPPSTLTWGPGNIELDPLFVDPDGSDDDPSTFGDNDYHLAAFSPCIDAGYNRPILGTLTDLDGNPRTVDDPTVADTGAGVVPIVDIGSYEKQ